MAEEYNENMDTDEDEDDGQDLWSLLKIDDPGPDPYEDEQDEQDEEVAKVDKMEKKLSAKMDNMQKKFEAGMIRERIQQFQNGASDLEKGLFKTIAADVKDIASLDKAMHLVAERAASMQAEAAKYKTQLEEQAQQQVAQAWGTGPVGTPSPRTKDYEEELMKKVEAGDASAAFEALVGDDWPSFGQGR